MLNTALNVQTPRTAEISTQVALSPEKQAIYEAFQHWHDPTRVTDDDIVKTRDALDLLDWNFAAKRSIFYNLSELRFEPVNGGPSVIDAEGWVTATQPARLKFNLFADPILLVDADPPAKTPAAASSIQARLAASDSEMAAAYASPESAAAAIRKGFAEGTPGAIILTAFSPPGSLRQACLAAGFAPSDDFVAATLLLAEVPAIGDQLARLELGAFIGEDTTEDGNLRRTYQLRDQNSATGDPTVSFVKIEGRWLVDI